MCWMKRDHEWGGREDEIGVYLGERHGGKDCNAQQYRQEIVT